jgi:hypothetical protein
LTKSSSIKRSNLFLGFLAGVILFSICGHLPSYSQSHSEKKSVGCAIDKKDLSDKRTYLLPKQKKIRGKYTPIKDFTIILPVLDISILINNGIKSAQKHIDLSFFYSLLSTRAPPAC